MLASLESQAIIVRAAPDEEIVGQGEPADHCYLVQSGCVRTVRLMEDGRRQVGEFLFPGDLFGWEALDEHDFGAEAVTAAMLRRYPRRLLEVLAERDRELARRLRTLTAHELRAGRERMLLLGRKTAAERIASFLLEIAARLGAEGDRPIELPMRRVDIADYLGLTIETVCRGLTQLRRKQIIAIERTQVAIRNLRALSIAGCQTMH
ncbi:MAG: helix-turn-helix domain-containing protein [Acetobacteraceae bacterium]